MVIRIVMFIALLLAAPGALAGYALSPYVNYPVGSDPESVAIGDVNGDGRNDVVLTTGSYFDPSNDYCVFIFIQNPDGTLAAPQKVTYAEFANRSGLVLADLDRDGRAEIIVGDGGGITVMKWGPFRNGWVSARRYSTVVNMWDSPVPAYYLAVLDVNRDGHLDIVGQGWDKGAAVYFGDGKGVSRTVKFPTPLQGYNDIASGDFNGDGYRDIALRSGQGAVQTRVYVYYNDGTDDFSAPLEIVPDPGYWASFALGAGDFNDDGRDDLVMQRDETSLWLFRQKALGGFEAPAILPTPSSVDVMVTDDLDLDGRQDLVAYRGGPSGIYLQDENGLTVDTPIPLLYGTPRAGLASHGIATGDVNGDQCPDIVAANFGSGLGLAVYHGMGCNTVADLSTSVGLNATRVAVRLDNFGNAAATAPEVTVVLSVTSGNLALGALPAGCSITAQTPLRTDVLCAQGTLASQRSRTVILPISVAGSAQRNLLTVTATANTPTVESRLDNNLATATLWGALATPIQIQRSAPRTSTAKVSRQRLGSSREL